MENIYLRSGTPLVWLGAQSPCLALTAASLGQGARLIAAGPNPCEKGEALPCWNRLRKWLSFLAPLAEGFCGDVHL